MRHLSEEQKRKIGDAQRGAKNHLRGKKLSEEHRQKISKSLTGKKRPSFSWEWIQKLSEARKGEKNPMYGKHVSEKTRQKISMAKKGVKLTEETKRKMSESHRGEKCQCWKGGISFEPYGMEFNDALKIQIRQRDHYICQECGYSQKKLGYNLHVHHIDFNKRNNASNNLISLCRSCHAKTSFNRKKWIRYYQSRRQMV